MADTDLRRRVRELRADGRSPKEIARALGVSRAMVDDLVRAIAAEEARAAPEPAVIGCWVSPGWSEGLGIEGHPDWPGRESGKPAMTGLVTVLVAREHRKGLKVSACTYLVDTYCLGVKDAIGPRVMDKSELGMFRQAVFGGYDDPPIAVPIEVPQQLVFGAVEYARGLGFQPHRDFEPAAGHLGSLPEKFEIRFGCDGEPYFIEGPYDDARRIMKTLTDSVGTNNFKFLVRADGFDLMSA